MIHESESIYIKYIPVFRILYLSLKFAELRHFKVRGILGPKYHFNSHYIEYLFKTNVFLLRQFFGLKSGVNYFWKSTF